MEENMNIFFVQINYLLLPQVAPPLGLAEEGVLAPVVAQEGDFLRPLLFSLFISLVVVLFD